MTAAGESSFGVGTDFGVLIASMVILVAVAARVYPPIVT